MAVIPGIWLLEAGFTRVSTFLCLFRDDPCTAPLRYQEPCVMYAEVRSLDAPSDLTVWIRHINPTRDRESEGPPIKPHAFGESPHAAFEMNVGGVRIPARPGRCVDQVGPDHLGRRFDPTFIVHEDIHVARLESLWPVNQRSRLTDVVRRQVARLLGMRRECSERHESGPHDQCSQFHRFLHFGGNDEDAPALVDENAFYPAVYIRSVPNARPLEVAIWLRIRFRANEVGARCRDPEGKAAAGCFA